MVGIAHAKIPELLGRLEPAGFRPKRYPPALPLGDVRLVQLLYDPPGVFLTFQVDLLVVESEYHRLALSRRVAMRLPGLDIEIAVLTCEDLILHKLLAGRILDRADSVALLVANRVALDREFLAEWARRLGVMADLCEIWQTAFPGETFHSG